MRRHVSQGHIGATLAAEMLAAAEKAGRQEEFLSSFEHWTGETRRLIQAEEDSREARGERPMSKAKREVRSHLTPQLVEAWRQALKKERLLPQRAPRSNFRAVLDTTGGIARIEIASLSKSVREMSAAELAIVLERCLDLSRELEPVLLSKAADERLTSNSETDGQAGLRPGRARLVELGLGSLVGEAGPAEEEGEEAEAELAEEAADEAELAEEEADEADDAEAELADVDEADAEDAAARS
jgi:hypothetical protein